jgi:hypothetical protein
MILGSALGPDVPDPVSEDEADRIIGLRKWIEQDIRWTEAEGFQRFQVAVNCDEGYALRMIGTLTSATGYVRYSLLLLQTLSSGSSGYADVLVSRTVRMWFDVSRADGRFDYVSLIDDSADVWRSTQLEVLGDLSGVVAWGDRDRFMAELAEG